MYVCCPARALAHAVFRQADEVFVQILNDLREGRGQNALVMLQQRCMRPLPCVHEIRPTELYARNADVDNVNATELAKLGEAEMHEFHAADDVASAMAMKMELDGQAADRSMELRIRQQKVRAFTYTHTHTQNSMHRTYFTLRALVD